jgi:flagellar biosynthesis/type III secretory pathway protein FliH
MKRYTFEPLVQEEEKTGTFSDTLPSYNDEATEPQIEIIPELPESYDESQLELAKQQSYQTGYNAAKVELDNNTSRQASQIQVTVEQINNKLKELIELHTTQNQEIAQDLIQLALHVAKKIAGNVINKDPLPFIEKTINEVISTIEPQGKLEVIVNPALIEHLKEKLASNIELHPNDQLLPGDCIVNWNTGKAEYRLDDMLEKISF